MTCITKCHKSRIRMYIFAAVAYLVTFGLFNASANESLRLCKHNPDIVPNSFIIKLVTNR